MNKDGALDARFFSLRGSGMLFIQMDNNGQVNISNLHTTICIYPFQLEVHVRCEDMELCGDVVQALGEYLGLNEMVSAAEFPTEIDRLMSMIEKVYGSNFSVSYANFLIQVNEIYVVRDQMSADVADHSNLIKALLIRAEDARLMRDM